MKAGDGVLIAVVAMLLAAYLVLKLWPIPSAMCVCERRDFDLWESELGGDDLLDVWNSTLPEVGA